MRNWIITGISSGLGYALAAHVTAAGDAVFGTVRSEAKAKELRETFGDKCHVFVLDVTDAETVSQFVREVQQRTESIDVLVNSAGIGFAGAIEEASLIETRNVMEVNFFAVLQVTQLILPIMRKQGFGRIVQISSHAGIKAFAGFGVYNASKFALEGFSEALVQEVQPLGIHVSLVEPGPFRTAFAGTSLHQANERISAYDDTAGIFRNKLASVDGKQEGDPKKAAEALWELSKQEKPPLRLILGATALKTIGIKRDELDRDLKASEAIAQACVY